MILLFLSHRHWPLSFLLLARPESTGKEVILWNRGKTTGQQTRTGTSSVWGSRIAALRSALIVTLVHRTAIISWIFSKFWRCWDLSPSEASISAPVKVCSIPALWIWCTNGFTVRNLSDGDLRLFHDVDFSLDFPDPVMNDTWRGLGSFQGVHDGIQRCRDLGVEASLVTCLMKENYAYLGKLAELAVQWGVNLRVNVYKSVLSREHQADYHQFWQAIADMAQAAYFTACSEPIVNAAIGNGRACHGIPCGQRSFRVHPDGLVTSCVYLQSSKITISHLIDNFEEHRASLVQTLELQVPQVCRSCPVLEKCGGGCSSRRILGQPEQPDEYCFILRGEQPVINARWKASKDLVHENYLCTMIFCG
jgi:radical SAM protein with 4Fe4S-binding SPASM domain